VIEKYNLVEGIEMQYVIEIFYSEEDRGYIAVVPELLGCSAFGETEEEALKEIKVAIELWIDAAKKEGRKIPKPMDKELLKAVVEKIESKA
jgi:predicted RNase H-like HicB family nuclease